MGNSTEVIFFFFIDPSKCEKGWDSKGVKGESRHK